MAPRDILKEDCKTCPLYATVYCAFPKWLVQTKKIVHWNNQHLYLNKYVSEAISSYCKIRLHAIAHAIKISKKMKNTESIVVTLSGRGDKDIDIVKEYLAKNVKNKRKI